MTTDTVPKPLADFRAECAKARPQFLEMLATGLHNLSRRRDSAVLLTALLAELGDAIKAQATTKREEPAKLKRKKNPTLDEALNDALSEVLG